MTKERSALLAVALAVLGIIALHDARERPLSEPTPTQDARDARLQRNLDEIDRRAACEANFNIGC